MIIAEGEGALGYAGQVMNMKACARQGLEDTALAQPASGGGE